jgi:hypothetical protein
MTSSALPLLQDHSIVASAIIQALVKLDLFLSRGNDKAFKISIVTKLEK